MPNGVDDDQPSERLVAQRIRNRVMEYLALAASYEEQQQYERAAPIAHLPYAVINQWEDNFPRGSLEADLRKATAFTVEEADALRAFQQVWETTCAAVPDDYPSLHEVQALRAWQLLAQAANAALAVLDERGQLPEDVDVP